MSVAENKAVFLSYASQDAEAAKRICAALRAAGVEVWFDQSELRGGDAWDAKIRKQIKECALFVPVISANTQARMEGYFRLEWHLAEQRTYLMAHDRAFLVPVVVDDTPDAIARVPERFRERQWTRLAGDMTSARFADQVKGLLDIAGTSPAESAVRINSAAKIPPTARRRRLIAISALGLAAAAVGTIGWRSLRTRYADGGPSPAVSNTTPRVSTLSPARELAARSAELHDQRQNALRSDLELAEQLCKQAIGLDPNDGEVRAEFSLVHSAFIAQMFDRSNERRTAARTEAERATRLAPDSQKAQFALAYAYRWQSGMEEEAERRLRELLERSPEDKRLLRALGNTLRVTGRFDEALVYYRRAIHLPGGDPLALFQSSMVLAGRDPAEAIRAVEMALKLHPSPAAYVRMITLLLDEGRLEEARENLSKVPLASFAEERCAYTAYSVWSWSRQPDRCIQVLSSMPDIMSDAMFQGPRGLLSGDAHRLAKRPSAAIADWRAALQVLQANPGRLGSQTHLHLRRAQLLARLGENEEAARVLKTFEEFAAAEPSNLAVRTLDRAGICVELGRLDEALKLLVELPRRSWILANLGYDPQWDPLRAEPRFAALLDVSADKSAGKTKQ